jgi:hypothetical protein
MVFVCRSLPLARERIGRQFSLHEGKSRISYFITAIYTMSFWVVAFPVVRISGGSDILHFNREEVADHQIIQIT